MSDQPPPPPGPPSFPSPPEPEPAPSPPSAYPPPPAQPSWPANPPSAFQPPPPPGSPPGQGWPGSTQAWVVQRTPPLAGLALGLGAASVVVDLLFAPVGILLGIAAIVLGVAMQLRIGRPGSGLGGRGLAMAGWICGVVGVGLPVLVFLAAFIVGFVTALQGG